MEKQWFLKKTNREFVDYLAAAADISPLLARVLINRDIKTPESAKEFLHSRIDSLSDPFAIPFMGMAVERIQSALQKGELILVHGDYDADGTTATAILVETLTKLGGRADYFIPERFKHGYGFNAEAVDKAAQDKVGLIVTVDCGISSFESVEAARKYGIDVIVTDHHEPLLNPAKEGEFLLPDAHSIINPKLQGSDSPLSILTGAGISLKLSQALLAGEEVGSARSLLDMATVGTVADVAPLTGENRVIVKEGLKVLAEGRRPGIRALLQLAKLTKRELEPDLLAYTIIPRINAAGRMETAAPVVKLLTTTSETEAALIAEYLDSLNMKRQRIEEDVLESALFQIEHRGYDRVIVLADEDWHEGVLGIVASKLVDRFQVPAFVFSIRNGIAKGSARGVPALDLCETIAGCSGCLIQFGGHKQAAGLKLYSENLPLFESQINSFVKSHYKGDDFIQTLTIDSEISLNDINHKLLNDLAKLGPFGYGNPEPLFGSKGLMPMNPRIVGKNHLKLRLAFNGCHLEAIGYDLGKYLHAVSTAERVDAVFSTAFNEWNGARSIQLSLKAIRPGV